MITQQHNSIVCSNSSLQLRLALEPTLHCAELTHLAQGQPVAYTAQTGELFRFSAPTGSYGAADFEVEQVTQLADETEELVAVTAYCAALQLRVRFSISLQATGSLHLLLQSCSDRDYPQELRVSCPFLVNLTLAGAAKHYCPSSPLYRSHPLFHYPYVLTDSDDRFGYSVALPSLSDLVPAAQNRNVDLWGIASRQALERHSLPLRLGKVFSDTFELELRALEQGWRQAFAEYRTAQRHCFDLAEHQRPELQWLRQTLLHHFTYLYGKESYNYQQDCVDIPALLEQGEAFGGYDTITLWHQYPRLGVDERNQWDFFDDFPGGRAGLRSTVQQAHAQGVRVFLPYKPWDIGDDQSMDGTAQQLVQLVADSDIDGLFLDTMNNVPPSFRPSLDRQKPGVAFCAEVHPGNREAVNAITSSWGKSKAVDPIPMLDYFRFVLPEHPVPIISRWATDTSKDRLIERAIFSTTGLVIWQDVFGTWLPYSEPQKDRIRAYKAVWHQNRAALDGMHPIPLYPCLGAQVLCNYFPADDGSTAVLTFCNQGSERYCGPLARLPAGAVSSTALFGEQAFLQDGLLHGEVLPERVTAIRVDWRKTTT